MKTIAFILVLLASAVVAEAQNCAYAVLDTTNKRIETREVVVSQGEHPLLFRLSNFSNFRTFKVNFFINHSIGCFDYGDKMTIELADGSTLQLTNVGEEDCGDHVEGKVQYATAFFLTEEVINKLRSSGLKKINLSSGDESFDFEIKEQYADYFNKYLNCIKLNK